MRKSMIIKLLFCSLCLSLIMGCSKIKRAEKAQVNKPRMTLFVGIDLSSSFYKSAYQALRGCQSQTTDFSSPPQPES